VGDGGFESYKIKSRSSLILTVGWHATHGSSSIQAVRWFECSFFVRDGEQIVHSPSSSLLSHQRSRSSSMSDSSFSIIASVSYCHGEQIVANVTRAAAIISTTRRTTGLFLMISSSIHLLSVLESSIGTSAETETKYTVCTSSSILFRPSYQSLSNE